MTLNDPIPSASRARYSLTPNIWKTVRDTDIGTYIRPTVSFRMILSDLEWLIKIFDDTKHRAASLLILFLKRTIYKMLMLEQSSEKWPFKGVIRPSVYPMAPGRLQSFTSFSDPNSTNPLPAQLLLVRLKGHNMHRLPTSIRRLSVHSS